MILTLQRHLLLLLLLSACSLSGPRTGSAKKTLPPDNYTNGRFVNIEKPRAFQKQLRSLWRLMCGTEQRRPPAPLPMLKPHMKDFAVIPYPFRHIWLGHSTHIIEMDSIRILTDPVFSTYASPVPGIMKRFQPTPIPLSELPPIDVVLITHDHYDHLDKPSVVALAKRGIPFIVPLGVGARLRSWGIARRTITELNWWQETRVHRIRVILTPSRHFSGRSLFDRNTTLWGSYSVVGPTRRLYVSGDGGYGKHFTKIGQKYGPFDLTIIDIGAYGESWPDIHLTPEQAVQAHRDLRGRVMIPGHWGTFKLAIHAWDDPIRRAFSAAKRAHIRLATPMLGQFTFPAKKLPRARWWRSLKTMGTP